MKKILLVLTMLTTCVCFGQNAKYYTTGLNDKSGVVKCYDYFPNLDSVVICKLEYGKTMNISDTSFMYATEKYNGILSVRKDGYITITYSIDGYNLIRKLHISELIK